MASLHDALARALGRARYAPSADNCQPFTFHGGPDALELRWSAARAAHVLDRARAASWLTLGATLETLRLAAGAEGLAVAEELRSLHAGDGQAWATLRFSPGAEADPLAAQIERRCTDRRLYRRVSFDDIQMIQHKIIYNSSNVRLHLRRPPSGRLLGWMRGADALMWRQPALVRDIARWVRFSPDALRAAGDGIGSDAFGLPPPALRLFQVPGAERLVVASGLDRAHGLWLRALLGTASALLLISASRPGPEALVDTGRLATRAWLRFTAAGLAAQPMTILSLPVYAAATDTLPADTPPAVVAHHRAGRAAFAEAFALPDGALPVWLFRVGGAPRRPPPRSPRRPLEEVWTR